MRKFLTALWQGKVPSVKTYWLYGVLGFSLVGIPFSAIELTVDVLLLCSLCAVAYVGFIIFAAWKSASQIMAVAGK